ncbi:hypothetical protein D3C71_1097650 [compost metagenome]
MGKIFLAHSGVVVDLHALGNAAQVFQREAVQRGEENFLIVNFFLVVLQAVVGIIVFQIVVVEVIIFLVVASDVSCFAMIADVGLDFLGRLGGWHHGDGDLERVVVKLCAHCYRGNRVVAVTTVCFGQQIVGLLADALGNVLIERFKQFLFLGRYSNTVALGAWGCASAACRLGLGLLSFQLLTGPASACSLFRSGSSLCFGLLTQTASAYGFLRCRLCCGGRLLLALGRRVVEEPRTFLVHTVSQCFGAVACDDQASLHDHFFHAVLGAVDGDTLARQFFQGCFVDSHFRSSSLT